MTAADRAPNGYSVRWRERRSDSRLTAVNRVAGTSFTIPNLTNGTTYLVRVDTRNEANNGIQADTLVSGTGTPDASGNLAPTVVAIGDRSLTFGARVNVDVDASDVDRGRPDLQGVVQRHGGGDGQPGRRRSATAAAAGCG